MRRSGGAERTSIERRLSLRECGDFDDGVNFDGAPAAGGDLAGNLDCLVEMAGFDEEEAAQLVVERNR